jgi:hypothetical protein
LLCADHPQVGALFDLRLMAIRGAISLFEWKGGVIQSDIGYFKLIGYQAVIKKLNQHFSRRGYSK